VKPSQLSPYLPHSLHKKPKKVKKLSSLEKQHQELIIKLEEALDDQQRRYGS
jgi:hypothetical protein